MVGNDLCQVTIELDHIKLNKDGDWYLIGKAIPNIIADLNNSENILISNNTNIDKYRKGNYIFYSILNKSIASTFRNCLLDLDKTKWGIKDVYLDSV